MEVVIIYIPLLTLHVIVPVSLDHELFIYLFNSLLLSPCFFCLFNAVNRGYLRDLIFIFFAFLLNPPIAWTQDLDIPMSWN